MKKNYQIPVMREILSSPAQMLLAGSVVSSISSGGRATLSGQYGEARTSHSGGVAAHSIAPSSSAYFID